MQISGRTAGEMRGRISVQFQGEEGIDAGGLTREWFIILSREIFNPNWGLFRPSAEGQSTYQPNPHSHINADHLAYFRFVGRVIGKAIADGCVGWMGWLDGLVGWGGGMGWLDGLVGWVMCVCE